MSDYVRPASLRRRDRNAVLIVAAVAVCNLATSVLYWVVTRHDVRRAVADVSRLGGECFAAASNAVARTDALAAVVLRHSAVAGSLSSGSSDDSEPASPPVVLGVGRTKNYKGERRYYYDTRDADGVVHRRYLEPPSRQNRSALPALASVGVGAERPAENVTESDRPPFYENALDEARFEENEKGP